MDKELRWYSFRWKTGLALILFCLLAWWIMRGRFIHPIGKGPAGPKISAEQFVHPWSTDRILFMSFGDSITSGYGSTPGHSYVDLLIHNDDATIPDMKGRDLSHVFPKMRCIDSSEPYTTSRENLKTQFAFVSKHPAEKGVVVITSGGNDVIHDYGYSKPKEGAMYGCTAEQAMKWKGEYKDRLRKMVRILDEKFPKGCEIFLANVYDPTDGVGDIHNAHPFLMLHPWRDGVKVLAIWNDAISEICDEYPNVHLVDLHTPFLGHGIHCTSRRNPYYHSDDPHYWYFENLEDPNDRGFDAVRRIFLQEMIKVLSKDIHGRPGR